MTGSPLASVWVRIASPAAAKLMGAGCACAAASASSGSSTAAAHRAAGHRRPVRRAVLVGGGSLFMPWQSADGYAGLRPFLQRGTQLARVRGGIERQLQAHHGLGLVFLEHGVMRLERLELRGEAPADLAPGPPRLAPGVEDAHLDQMPSPPLRSARDCRF